ncbi:PTS sugar transporter subunit IIA, partial [Streptococcus pasteurianus]
EDAIRAAGQLLVDDGDVEEEYIDSMLAREEVVSTHMGNFIAIPHGTDEGKDKVKATGISVIQVPFGVDFAPDEPEEKMA